MAYAHSCPIGSLDWVFASGVPGHVTFACLGSMWLQCEIYVQITLGLKNQLWRCPIKKLYLRLVLPWFSQIRSNSVEMLGGGGAIEGKRRIGTLVARSFFILIFLLFIYLFTLCISMLIIVVGQTYNVGWQVNAGRTSSEEQILSRGTL